MLFFVPYSWQGKVKRSSICANGQREDSPKGGTKWRLGRAAFHVRIEGILLNLNGLIFNYSLQSHEI